MKLTAAAILAEVRANHALLDACPKPHAFERDDSETDRSILFRRFKCLKCGGTVDSLQGHYYMLGLSHARLNRGRKSNKSAT